MLLLGVIYVVLGLCSLALMVPGAAYSPWWMGPFFVALGVVQLTYTVVKGRPQRSTSDDRGHPITRDP